MELEKSAYLQLVKNFRLTKVWKFFTAFLRVSMLAGFPLIGIYAAPTVSRLLPDFDEVGVALTLVFSLTLVFLAAVTFLYFVDVWILDKIDLSIQTILEKELGAFIPRVVLDMIRSERLLSGWFYEARERNVYKYSDRKGTLVFTIVPNFSQ